MGGHPWLEPPQQYAVMTAMQIVRAWAEERDDPDAALMGAFRQRDTATAMLGLATVARLLAVELGTCSRRTEVAVLDDLADHVSSATIAIDGA